MAEAEAAGFPIFDVVLETPWYRTEDAATGYRRMFDAIPEGLTFMSMHFNAPGDFEAVEPDLAHIRVEEYELFRTPAFIDWGRDLTIVGFRPIRDALRVAWRGGVGPRDGLNNRHRA